MTEACHHAVAAAQHFQSTLLLKYRRTIAARRLTHVNAKIAKSVVFYFCGSSWSEAFQMREAAMKSAIVQVSPKGSDERTAIIGMQVLEENLP